MPNVTVAVTHDLDSQEALRRLKDQFLEAQSRFAQHLSDFDEDWSGNVGRFGFKTMGIHVQGTVTAEDSQVVVVTELPLIAMPFKSAIDRQIRDELEKILA